MISETTFAQDHTSTWRLLTPTLDRFTRKLNLQLYEREFEVLRSTIDPSRRALVNEIAFNLFCDCPALVSSPDNWRGQTYNRIFEETRRRISFLDNSFTEAIEPLSESEIADGAEQVSRLQQFFKPRPSSQLILRPRFRGAGIIDSCDGDICFGSKLYEVKAGQRPYRAIDLKQLITYAALNFAGRDLPITHLGLFNPRMGTSFCDTIDNICVEISGYPGVELFAEIIRVISSGDLSR
jgi:hypothetical protein